MVIDWLPLKNDTDLMKFALQRERCFMEQFESRLRSYASGCSFSFRDEKKYFSGNKGNFSVSLSTLTSCA